VLAGVHMADVFCGVEAVLSAPPLGEPPTGYLATGSATTVAKIAVRGRANGAAEGGPCPRASV
jgi:hypothetical protein